MRLIGKASKGFELSTWKKSATAFALNLRYAALIFLSWIFDIARFKSPLLLQICRE